MFAPGHHFNCTVVLKLPNTFQLSIKKKLIYISTYAFSNNISIQGNVEEQTIY